MQGLAYQTSLIFEAISRLDCIKPYCLVGGTALSLQLGSRLSEDLDFMSWRKSRSEKREVDWPTIKKEFETIGQVDNFEILDIGHIEFTVDGVKISFYANPNYSPLMTKTSFVNNISIADLTSIGAMKMEVMLRRSKFRDYYEREFGICTWQIKLKSLGAYNRAARLRSPNIDVKDCHCQRTSCPFDSGTSKSKFTSGLVAKKQYAPIAASMFIRKLWTLR